MSKVVAFIAPEEKRDSTSARLRKAKARTTFGSLRRAQRMTSLDAMARKLGYEMTRVSGVGYLQPLVAGVLIKHVTVVDEETIPRIQKMSFSEASKLSQDMYNSREQRLKDACFDGPE
jgi:hypothetical protein